MDWAPDWSGEICAIIGAGPSANAGQAAEAAKRARIIAVNNAWQLAPNADALYACDGNWWDGKGAGYGQQALREFAGLMVSQDKAACDRYRALHYVELRHGAEISTEPGVIGSGQNSGFQALNIGVLFGCRRFILLGFDMQGVNGNHFHADHPKPLGNPDLSAFQKWRGAFNDAEAQLRRLGVEVFNCTPGSALNVFPKAQIAEVLEYWSDHPCHAHVS